MKEETDVNIWLPEIIRSGLEKANEPRLGEGY